MAMTTLSRWSPFKEMEDILNRPWRRTAPSADTGHETLTLADWSPAVDIAEDDKEYTIKTELPEVNKEDVTVNVHHGVLTIQGERKIEHEEKNKKFHRVERSYGTFVRRFTLPDGVDEASVAARFKEGMLYVTIAKVEPVQPKAVQIEID
jgi:HSP20 family protein